jgi:glycosyltransferase involved in cell wall biosynthesis
MRAPFATIGIPVYNGERFLAQCLESALAQTRGDLEIVISDNASTDGSGEICRHYAALDSRITYLRADENYGAAWNHNRVALASRAPLFKWLAADDYLEPRFMEVCAAVLEERRDAVLCYPATTVIDERGLPVPMDETPLPLDSPDVTVRFSRLLSPWKACHNPFYGVLRLAALLRSRMLGAFLGADRALLAELSLLGPFVQQPERLFYRRKHPGNQNLADSAQQVIFSPDSGKRIVLREARLLREQLSIVAASSLPLSTRLRLAVRALRHAASGSAMLAKEFRAAAGQAARGARPYAQRPSNREICE